jgi:uncharacterized protein YjaZ
MSNPDSSFFILPSNLICDFNFVDILDSNGKGEYFDETERAMIYLYPHNQIDDLISTINHEVYHHTINIHEVKLDTSQEEKLINKLIWTQEGVLI